MLSNLSANYLVKKLKMYRKIFIETLFKRRKLIKIIIKNSNLLFDSSCLTKKEGMVHTCKYNLKKIYATHLL